jgi:hypothetical protein
LISAIQSANFAADLELTIHVGDIENGSSNNLDWLKVTINRPSADHVLSWERVPYQH